MLDSTEEAVGREPNTIYFGTTLMEFVSGTAQAVRFFTYKMAPTPYGLRRSASAFPNTF
jgi:hypothetical protein